MMFEVTAERSRDNTEILVYGSNETDVELTVYVVKLIVIEYSNGMTQYFRDFVTGNQFDTKETRLLVQTTGGLGTYEVSAFYETVNQIASTTG